MEHKHEIRAVPVKIPHCYHYSQKFGLLRSQMLHINLLCCTTRCSSAELKCISTNSTTRICCGFVVEQAIQQIESPQQIHNILTCQTVVDLLQQTLQQIYKYTTNRISGVRIIPFLGWLPKVDLIILERGKNVCPSIRPQKVSSIWMKFGI